MSKFRMMDSSETNDQMRRLSLNPSCAFEESYEDIGNTYQEIDRELAHEDIVRITARIEHDREVRSNRGSLESPLERDEDTNLPASEGSVLFLECDSVSETPKRNDMREEINAIYALVAKLATQMEDMRSSPSTTPLPTNSMGPTTRKGYFNGLAELPELEKFGSKPGQKLNKHLDAFHEQYPYQYWTDGQLKKRFKSTLTGVPLDLFTSCHGTFAESLAIFKTLIEKENGITRNDAIDRYESLRMQGNNVVAYCRELERLHKVLYPNDIIENSRILARKLMRQIDSWQGSDFVNSWFMAVNDDDIYKNVKRWATSKLPTKPQRKLLKAPRNESRDYQLQGTVEKPSYLILPPEYKGAGMFNCPKYIMLYNESLKCAIVKASKFPVISLLVIVAPIKERAIQYVKWLDQSHFIEFISHKGIPRVVMILPPAGGPNYDVIAKTLQIECNSMMNTLLSQGIPCEINLVGPTSFEEVRLNHPQGCLGVRVVNEKHVFTRAEIRIICSAIKSQLSSINISFVHTSPQSPTSKSISSSRSSIIRSRQGRPSATLTHTGSGHVVRSNFYNS